MSRYLRNIVEWLLNGASCRRNIRGNAARVSIWLIGITPVVEMHTLESG
jgi:hypothetical protein